MNEVIKKYENEHIDALGAESLKEYCKALKESLDEMTEMQVQAYRRSQILRRTIDVIAEKCGIDTGGLYSAIAEGNNYSLDDILYCMSR